MNFFLAISLSHLAEAKNAQYESVANFLMFFSSSNMLIISLSLLKLIIVHFGDVKLSIEFWNKRKGCVYW